MTPTISIVVPAFNEEEMMARCIESLLDLEYPSQCREIIIVDNNSTDSTPAIIKKYPVTYILEPRKGRSVARNTGIRASSGEIILFTDADCVVDRNWAQALVDGFTGSSTACCGGTTRSYDPGTVLERYFDYCFDRQQRSKQGFYEDYFIGPLFATCNLACRRSVFDTVGFFDETLVAAEDVDLVWRINLHGSAVRYAEDAVVYHKRRASLLDLPELLLQYMYWQYYIVEKYREHIGMSLDMWRLLAAGPAAVLQLLRHLARGRSIPALFALLDAVSAAARTGALFYTRITLGLSSHRFPPLGFAPRNILWRWKDRESVMVLKRKPWAGYTITGTGARIWELLAEGKKESAIAALVAEEYDVPAAEAAADVRTLVARFIREDLLPEDHEQERTA